jgi:hypothetical protein
VTEKYFKVRLILVAVLFKKIFSYDFSFLFTIEDILLVDVKNRNWFWI